MQTLLTFASILFVVSAGFQAWVFWELYRQQEIVLMEYSRAMNVLELCMAAAILCISIVALARVVAYLGRRFP